LLLCAHRLFCCQAHPSQPASRLAVLRCLSSLSGLHIRGSHYFGHEHSYIKDVSLSKGVRQDLAWIRNDPYIDELCVRPPPPRRRALACSWNTDGYVWRILSCDVCVCVQASMKLPIFACEEFGVHVVKYMQKVWRHP
jgi:hypothetical protein